MTEITFTVHGIPAPQGSKTPWGSEANPNTRPWRATVSDAAVEAMMTAQDGSRVLSVAEPLTGSLELHVTFCFPRPKGHYRTGKNAGVLKDNAPEWHTTKPDADKLLRAIGDALTGIVVRDDSQFARVIATKLYGSPCAVVTVTAL